MGRIALFMIYSLFLSGCALNHRIEKHAVLYNETVGDATNKVTLLNILRASEAEPLHFTAISQVRGNLSISSGATITPNINAASPVIVDGSVLEPRGNTYSPSVTGTVSSSPFFDVTVQNSQEFIRAILKPVDIETIELFIDQGYNPQFLAHLLIESITIDGSKYEFDEKNIEKTEKFYKLVQNCADQIDVLNVPAERITPIELTNKTTLSEFASAIESNVNFLSENNRDMKKYYATIDRDKKVLSLIVGRSQIRTYQDNIEICGDRSVLFDEKEEGYDIKIRSPRNIIYYIGEIVRLQNIHGMVPRIWKETSSNEEKTTKLVEFGWNKNNCKGSEIRIKVEFNKKILCVRDQKSVDPILKTIQDKDRTMQVIDFVQQLIGLSQSSEDLPRTSTVTLIN